MITLTAKGKGYAIWVLIGLAVLVAVYLLGKYDGSADATEAADVAAEQRNHAHTLALKKSADSLEVVSRKLAQAAAAAKQPHLSAIARTDSADTTAVHFRHDAEHLASDSTATRAQLAQAIDSMARADSILDSRRREERDKAMARIVALEATVQSDTAAMRAKDGELESLGVDLAIEQRIVKDVKAQQHGFMRRVVSGVVSVAAAGGCGALGSLAGPAVAVGAAGTCLAGVALWNP